MAHSHHGRRKQHTGQNPGHDLSSSIGYVNPQPAHTCQFCTRPIHNICDILYSPLPAQLSVIPVFFYPWTGKADTQHLSRSCHRGKKVVGTRCIQGGQTVWGCLEGHVLHFPNHQKFLHPKKFCTPMEDLLTGLCVLYSLTSQSIPPRSWTDTVHA